jgi:hypothetical protein
MEVMQPRAAQGELAPRRAAARAAQRVPVWVRHRRLVVLPRPKIHCRCLRRPARLSRSGRYGTRGSYKAIELVRTQDVAVYNNSVYSDLSFDRAFHAFEGSAGIRIFNNLVRAPSIRTDDAGASVENNLVGELAGVFVDPVAGNLHLSAAGAPQAVFTGLMLPDGTTDYDGEARPAIPALGADECAP